MVVYNGYISVKDPLWKHSSTNIISSIRTINAGSYFKTHDSDTCIPDDPSADLRGGNGSNSLIELNLFDNDQIINEKAIMVFVLQENPLVITR